MNIIQLTDKAHNNNSNNNNDRSDSSSDSSSALSLTSNHTDTMGECHVNDLSFSILWSPLPIITWFIPIIGHMGIADSHGMANDFQGSYYVGTQGRNRMAFGPVTRYLKLDISDLPGGAERWDEAIVEANQVYGQRVHNILCDNCHSHVANALNRMPLEVSGITKWDMVKLCFLVFVKGRFVSTGAIMSQFGPFLFLAMLWLVITRIL